MGASHGHGWNSSLACAKSLLSIVLRQITYSVDSLARSRVPALEFLGDGLSSASLSYGFLCSLDLPVAVGWWLQIREDKAGVKPKALQLRGVSGALRPSGIRCRDT